MCIPSRRQVIGALVAALGTVSLRGTAQGRDEVKQYLYVLRLVPRLQTESAWTAKDHEAVETHFARLKRATEAGVVLLAGRTEEPLDRTFGLVVFEAANDDAARSFMDADPTIVAGVMTATLHPYKVALMRG